jgi:hypothetical protein
MSWITRFGEPLCTSPEEAEEYIGSELKRAVPQGWSVSRISGSTMGWAIAKEKPDPGEWSIQEYNVRLPNSLDVVIFTHGNNDKGVLGLHHVFQNAMVIDASALRRFGMEACLMQLMSGCEPNEWGYT